MYSEFQVALAISRIVEVLTYTPTDEQPNNLQCLKLDLQAAIDEAHRRGLEWVIQNLHVLAFEDLPAKYRTDIARATAGTVAGLMNNRSNRP